MIEGHKGWVKRFTEWADGGLSVRYGWAFGPHVEQDREVVYVRWLDTDFNSFEAGNYHYNFSLITVADLSSVSEDEATMLALTQLGRPHPVWR